uniref:Uncharacterized protein n=1 Tax=Oryza glumipatula TaxID=40148 RepID=A0A0E0BKL6_9ORYZ
MASTPKGLQKFNQLEQYTARFDKSIELAGISLALAVKMAGFGQGGAGCGDSVPVVGGGEAGDGGQELEVAAATPANSGVGGGLGEHQWSEMSLRVATAEARALEQREQCSRRLPNRAVTPGGGAGGTPATR